MATVPGCRLASSLRRETLQVHPGKRWPEYISFAEHLGVVLKELRDNFETVQIEQMLEANKHSCQYPFKIGDSVFLDTRDLPLEYAESLPRSAWAADLEVDAERVAGVQELRWKF